jgi:hypothetical protein
MRMKCQKVSLSETVSCVMRRTNKTCENSAAVLANMAAIAKLIKAMHASYAHHHVPRSDKHVVLEQMKRRGVAQALEGMWRKLGATLGRLSGPVNFRHGAGIRN